MIGGVQGVGGGGVVTTANPGRRLMGVGAAVTGNGGGSQSLTGTWLQQ